MSLSLKFTSFIILKNFRYSKSNRLPFPLFSVRNSILFSFPHLLIMKGKMSSFPGSERDPGDPRNGFLPEFPTDLDSGTRPEWAESDEKQRLAFHA